MILGVLDFETTGTDLLQDEVTEVSQVIYSTGQRRIFEAGSFLVAGTRPIPKFIEERTGITNVARKKFGYDSQDSLQGMLDWLKKVDAVAGQNINQFDWELLRIWASHYRAILPPMLLIDTMWDLPGVQGRKLLHMAAEDGFLPMGQHGALVDCLTTLRLIENRLGNLDKIVERAKSPIVVLQSLQDRDHNELAKDRDASWNQIGGCFHWNDQPGHLWWKAVKEMDVEIVAKDAPFDVCIRRDLNLRDLWS
jgi:DNA polymerase III epsilon subunit-like protein